ncbi:unnamed protein product [Onchocerca ochengi]|uniref:GPI mannosyltransferase 2 n=1 Tax=Onchocerca ochengi TaxID=42157 RepID=A0A182ECV8_ONCOC|nr:unnamed protein product [Onchocerca ochengi]
MSIYTISCRIVVKGFGGIIPSTSAGVVLNFPSTTKWKNFDNRRNFSGDTHSTAITGLQTPPIAEWFEQSMKLSYNYAQSLVENSGLKNISHEHLGLYTWWKPSSWYRVFLESLHTNYDLSWLVTVICATMLIRMATLYLPALILWKRTRFEEPQLPLLHQIRSRIGSVILYSPNVGLFLTQYCGIKKMAEASYPDWTTCGILSFTDLTIPDPAFLLPSLTAICFTFAKMD